MTRQSIRPTRRAVIRGGTGFALGGLAGAGRRSGGRARQNDASRFDHVVVVMFENRSFDNLLGYLYEPGEKPGFEGVAGRVLANPIPADAPGADRKVVTVHPATNMDTPNPDPGEEYPHINTQLFGTVAPAGNRFAAVERMTAPFNAPTPGAVPSMDGFVADYVNQFRSSMGRMPDYDEYAQIMACYRPEQMPVLSALAKGFAVFDHWFCEVPSQTFPNRSFFHAATSSGFVVNAPTSNFTDRNDAGTIFDRLETAGLPWRVYVDPGMRVSFTGLIHAPRLHRYFATRFAPLDDFFADAAAGTLPAYAFIEPNMLYAHDDMHPPVDAMTHGINVDLPSSLLAGEALLKRVYDAVRTSATAAGSNFANTLLLVVFDEHGGTYDHVAPPAAPPPDPAAPAGQMGFRFDRSGVRLPAVAISAWLDSGTLVGQTFRSTSLIRTLRERWPLGGPLTGRDAVAPDIAPLLTRTTPRRPEEWPEVVAQPSPPMEQAIAPDAPLNEEGKAVLSAALAHERKLTGHAPAVDVETVTAKEAVAILDQLQAAVFPTLAARPGG